MPRLGRMAAIAVAAWMLLTTAQEASATSKGVCQVYSQSILTPAMESYWRWNLGSGAQNVGPLFMVPLPAGDKISVNPLITQGSESFSVRFGKVLVLPLTFWLGESYDDGTVDDPADYPFDFKASRVLLKVDGRVVVDSHRTKLDCLYVPPTYFRKPIAYAEPTDYGAVAAEWMNGLGILLPPLPPGQHIIDLQVESPVPDELLEYFGVIGFGYYNTWYVTVTRK